VALKEKTITLRGGLKMPAIGLGLWKLDASLAPELINSAIEVGYRHLDSASDYGNEDAVGEGIASAIKRGLCRREDLWVTSKLWNTYHDPKHVRPALERSLSALRLDYLDLYMIHFPIALSYVPFETRYPAGWFFDPDADEPRMNLARVPLADTWRAMEGLVHSGLVRTIGVCNYSTALLRDLLAYSSIPPAVLQIERHPLLRQAKLVRFCQSEGIAVTGFSPLGAQSYYSLGMAASKDSLLDHPIVSDIARRHARSAAQILLRWGIQGGTAVIPMTSRKNRLLENLSLFDFELSSDEMQHLNDLDCGQRFNDPGVFCEKAFNTFCPIYE
jgi:D-xylose reductase